MSARWDSYFRGIAESVAKNSRCMSRQIGAVLADGKFLIGTGFNGPPISVRHCDVRYAHILKGQHVCPRRVLGYSSGQALQMCPAAHAERNAIDISARLGHRVAGCTLYVTCLTPCAECAKSIINSGIEQVVVSEIVPYEKEDNCVSGLTLLEEAGVTIRTYVAEKA